MSVDGMTRMREAAAACFELERFYALHDSAEGLAPRHAAKAQGYDADIAGRVAEILAQDPRPASEIAQACQEQGLAEPGSGWLLLAYRIERQGEFGPHSFAA